MKPSGRWKRQETLCCSQSAAQSPKISYFQHIHKERNSDMTSFVGIITLLLKTSFGQFYHLYCCYQHLQLRFVHHVLN